MYILKSTFWKLLKYGNSVSCITHDNLNIYEGLKICLISEIIKNEFCILFSGDVEVNFQHFEIIW